MAKELVCPRCGARDSFIEGYLPETCVCRMCQSQLDWREIPGCGPDCKASRTTEEVSGASPAGGSPGGDAPGGTAHDVSGEQAESAEAYGHEEEPQPESKMADGDSATPATKG